MFPLKTDLNIKKMSVTDTPALNVSTLPNTSMPSDISVDGEDYLFTTLHGYHVTIGQLSIFLVMMCLGLWIILLNCLLIHTLIRYRAHLDVTDTFIHGLAITDALVGVLVLYNSTYNIVNFQNRYECLTRFGLIHAMLINSTGHVLLLTINRYIKIIKPLAYREIFKKRRIIILSGSVWCFSLLFGFSPLMGWSKEYKTTPDDETHTVCRYFGVMRPEFIVANVTFYWLPMITMIILYTHMGRIAFRHSKQIILQERRGSMYPGSRMFDSLSWRFTKTVLIIIGVYFFCWLPTGIFFMLQLAGTLNYHNLTKLGHILTFTTSFGFLNSLLNPIIYATKIPCVKRRFKKVFCCKDSTQEQQFIHSGVIFMTKSAENVTKSVSYNV